MNPCENSFYLSSIACAIFDCLSQEDVALLAANMVAVSDLLFAMLAQSERNEACCKEYLENLKTQFPDISDQPLQ